jgi:hypothetical protein
MTGKQIADILCKTRKKWGIGAYYTPQSDRYCVLGMLAARQGVNKIDLYQLHLRNKRFHTKFFRLSTLVWLNDTSETKAELIRQLEKVYATIEWPVMEFVEAVKQWVAKKKIRRLKHVKLGLGRLSRVSRESILLYSDGSRWGTDLRNRHFRTSCDDQTFN